MCGIIGYIGPKDVVPVLIDGLRRLEYRGYDSAGVAVVRDGAIDLRRSAGKLARLEEVIATSPIDGEYGIGHTRPSHRGERPSAQGLHRPDCRRAQRHHRELPRPEAAAPERRAQVRYGN